MEKGTASIEDFLCLMLKGFNLAFFFSFFFFFFFFWGGGGVRVGAYFDFRAFFWGGMLSIGGPSIEITAKLL